MQSTSAKAGSTSSSSRVVFPAAKRCGDDQPPAEMPYSGSQPARHSFNREPPGCNEAPWWSVGLTPSFEHVTLLRSAFGLSPSTTGKSTTGKSTAHSHAVLVPARASVSAGVVAGHWGAARHQGESTGVGAGARPERRARSAAPSAITSSLPTVSCGQAPQRSAGRAGRTFLLRHALDIGASEGMPSTGKGRGRKGATCRLERGSRAA
jgi:hypothetical protein